jgi:methylenetetrahydrofolate dehydrogenase (NADP+)/methenyltetrahydrofolate cyclohydrolase
MPEGTTTAQLVAKIRELSADPGIQGILLQHPAPVDDERAAFEAIIPSKDVDGVTIGSFGAMAFGLPGFDSCTPGGMVRLLEHYDIPIAGKHAVVIGRSAILGKPLAMLLLQRNATVTICHSRSQGLPDLVRQADIVCACVGRAKFASCSTRATTSETWATSTTRRSSARSRGLRPCRAAWGR